MKSFSFFIGLLFFFSTNLVNAQYYSLQIVIKNQPDNPVVLGTVSGEKFTPVDTLFPKKAGNDQLTKLVRYQFPKDAVNGMYRIIFGQTTYALVMDEPPQQLDFFYNNETVVFETDFKNPQTSLKISQSEENKVWFDFLKREKILREQIELIEEEVDYYHSEVSQIKSSSLPSGEMEAVLSGKANEFNKLQMEREGFVEKTVQDNQKMLVSTFINLYREPFRDAFLNPKERLEHYQREYFIYVDFNDERLIRSSVLTDKIFNYLVSWNQPGYTRTQREIAYIKAVNGIMSKVKPEGGAANPKVADFILDYLKTGFNRLGMDNIVKYINERYSG